MKNVECRMKNEEVVGGSIFIRHSTFDIRHSSFDIRHSSFAFLLSPRGVYRSLRMNLVTFLLYAALASTNPFAKESTLPFHAPPFNEIKDSDYQPAIEQGMTEEL